MAPRLKSSALWLGVLSLASICNAANVVSMNFTHKHSAQKSRDHGLLETTIQNFIPQFQYFVTADIGTPPQTNELLLDTGSSDTFVLVPDRCKNKSYELCEGGVYDKSKSSTYKDLPKMGKFHTAYADGTSIAGNWFNDVFALGSAKVKHLIMGLGTRNRGQFTGLVGIGLRDEETYCRECPYDNLPVQLVKQGLIKSKSFSLYLDDAAASTGKLLFGGYDTAKFKGNLKMLPYMKTYYPDKVNDYALPFTALGVNPGSGSKVEMQSFKAEPAIFDSGTTGLYLHSWQRDLVLKKLPNATQFKETPHRLDCALRNLKGSIDFGFGEGDNQVIIPVPFSELVVPRYNPDGSRHMNHQGQHVCHFTIYATGGRPFMGQYFMRSAYVLFDLENKAGGLAPAVFDSTTSKFVEYDPHGKNERIDRAGINANVKTMTATTRFVATVTYNPANDHHYTKSFSSLGPIRTSQPSNGHP